MNVLDKHLAPHANALVLRQKRMEVLGANIANAATPNYKARDIDFRSALAAAVAPQSGPGGAAAPPATPELMYRRVLQPSIDGNTVDMDVERAQFAENAVHYEANINFLTHEIRMMLAALQG